MMDLHACYARVFWSCDPALKKHLSLAPFVVVFVKRLCCKNSIISMIMLHLYIRLLPLPLLKYFLFYGGFTCSKRNLIIHPNNTSSGIIEDGASIKVSIMASPTKIRWHPTRCFHYKLVSGKKISGLVLVSIQNTFLLGDSLMS